MIVWDDYFHAMGDVTELFERVAEADYGVIDLHDDRWIRRWKSWADIDYRAFGTCPARKIAAHRFEKEGLPRPSDHMS
jgi:hypothetical protein